MARTAEHVENTASPIEYGLPKQALHLLNSLRIRPFVSNADYWTDLGRDFILSLVDWRPVDDQHLVPQFEQSTTDELQVFGKKISGIQSLEHYYAGGIAYVEQLQARAVIDDVKVDELKERIRKARERVYDQLHRAATSLGNGDENATPAEPQKPRLDAC